MPNRYAVLCIFALSCFCTVCGRSFAGDGDRPLAKIDKHLSAALALKKIRPAERCSDAEFVRRIHLDLVGAIPSEDQALAFIESQVKQKRRQLIEQLLESEAFASHWAVTFDVMLMERRPDKYVTSDEWRNFLTKSFSNNKPLDKLFRQILVADGVDQEMRPAAKFYLDRAVDKDTLVRDISRIMLGMNLQCAQCHDHPDIDDYLHKHYHGLSVFVAGSKTFKGADGKFVLQEVAMREVEFASVFEPETTNKTGPRLLEALMEVPEFAEGEEYVEKPSRTVRSVPKFSLRKLLSQKLPSNETPEFARNLANRVWAKMMGRGIVHPLDMHHSGNPPSHPELLESLAAQLVQTDYDLKELLRTIALSDAYQRSSLLPPNADPKSIPEDSFAVANMKGLTPEQLFESLLTATQGSQVLAQQIDRELADQAAEKAAEAASKNKPSNDKKPSNEKKSVESKVDPAQLAEERKAMRNKKLAEFVAVFGNVPGQPEGEFSASLAQALFLANSETVSTWVKPGPGNLTRKLSALQDPKQVAKSLFLSVLSRMPTQQETKLVSDYLANAGQGPAREKAIAELIWSQLASAEFRLNH